MVRKHLAALVAGVAVFAGSGFSQAQTLKLGEVTYNRGFVQQIPDKGAGDQMVGVFKPHLALLAADKNHGKGMNPANLRLATGSAVRFTIGADASTKSGQTTTSSTFIVVPVVGMDRSKFEAVAIRWYSQDWRQPLIVDQLAVHRPGRGIDEIAMYRGKATWVKVQDRIIACTLGILKTSHFGKSQSAESEEKCLRGTSNLFEDVKGLMARSGNSHYATALGFSGAMQLETAGHSTQKVLDSIGGSNGQKAGGKIDWREIARDIWKSIKDDVKGLLKKLLKEIMDKLKDILMIWLKSWI